MSYIHQADSLKRHLAIAPLSDRLMELAPASADRDLWDSVIDQAVRLCASDIDPLGAMLDRNGVELVAGRVRTSPAHGAAWRQFSELGWLGLCAPEPFGQDLPQALLIACEELFNRASVAFMMLAVPTRTGAGLLLEFADDATRQAWVPRLLAGEWTATICISEPDAGSDVGRIRTRAARIGDAWCVTGEKCWISYGDHDLAERIGHFVLARTGDEPGVRGLSLFLIPSTLDDGDLNAVVTRRLEEKLGLHGSPTCALGFEGAQAILLGEEGRGLQHMFQMMLQMRLACGPQGTGAATAAFHTALSYARERRQGGAPDHPPMPICEHADVQRQLLSMAAAVELTRGLNIAAAQAMDLARLETDSDQRDRWAALAQFLLPIVKDGGAWAAVDCSSGAIQVLGGAGYTREWPVERMLRDARVFPVFEGTTGIQAIDLLHRRLWRDRRAGIDMFLSLAGGEAETCPQLAAALDLLADTAAHLVTLRESPRDAEAGATAFLDLCRLCAWGWISARILRLAGMDETGAHMRAAAGFFLAELVARAAMSAQLAVMGAGPVSAAPVLKA